MTFGKSNYFFKPTNTKDLPSFYLVSIYTLEGLTIFSRQAVQPDF